MVTPIPKINRPKAANRLNGWKEIAEYIGRGTRTVQRWHCTLQLPIHKANAKARGEVFAYKVELTSGYGNALIGIK